MSLYVYYVENCGVPAKWNRSNRKLFLLLNHIKLKEERVYSDAYDNESKSELHQLLEEVSKGDTVVVKTLEDLSFTLKGVIQVLEAPESKAVHLVVMQDERSLQDYLAALHFACDLEQRLRSIRRIKGYLKAVMEKRVGRKKKEEEGLYSYQEVETVSKIMLSILQKTKGEGGKK